MSRVSNARFHGTLGRDTTRWVSLEVSESRRGIDAPHFGKWRFLSVEEIWFEIEEKTGCFEREK
jgi:hypothetical protein